MTPLSPLSSESQLAHLIGGTEFASRTLAEWEAANVDFCFTAFAAQRVILEWSEWAPRAGLP